MHHLAAHNLPPSDNDELDFRD